MTDEYKAPNGGGTPGQGEAWREVGEQFKVLGKTLADAFRVSWQSEENRRRFQELRTGLETMVKEITKAINESMTSPQAQEARSQAARTAETVRTAGEQSAQEIRVELLAALRQINEELRKCVNRMESSKPSGPPPSDG